MSQRNIWRTVACLILVLSVAGAAHAQNPASAGQRQNQTPPNQPGNLPEKTPVPARNERVSEISNPSTADESNAFVNQAIEANRAEVQLGRLAASKAQNERVKAYANMLVKDHSAALQKLQALPRTGRAASSTPLSTEYDKLKTRLSGLSGAQFDREYIDAMIAGHREAVGLFEKQIGSRGLNTASARGTTASGRESTTSSNTPGRDAVGAARDTSPVDAVARELLPTIRHHLEQAEQIQKSLAMPAK